MDHYTIQSLPGAEKKLSMTIGMGKERYNFNFKKSESKQIRQTKNVRCELHPDGRLLFFRRHKKKFTLLYEAYMKIL